MGTLLQDLRLALRGVLKRPGFSLVVTLTLALGIGANTAIFSVVNAVLLSALPYHEPERLVALSSKVEAKNLTGQPVSHPNARDWREQNQVFAELAAVRGELMSLSDAAEAERVNVVRASADILPLLGAKPILGRDFRPDEEQPGQGTVAIVSHGLWQRRFGGAPQIIGQTIKLDGTAFTVIGVLPAWLKQPGVMLPSLPPAGADVWIPLIPATYEQDRSLHNLRVIARLKPGVSLRQAREDMNGVASRLEQQYPAINANIGIELQPLHEQVVGRVRQALWILAGAVGFVLLIACANVANLLLARAADRQSEIAIRTALGATRGRLVRQLLTESVVLGLAGGLGGVLLAAWGVPLLTRLSAGGIPRADEIGLHRPVLLFALLISLATGLVFGLLPAFQSSRGELAGTLKEGGKGGGVPHRRWLSALVVAEIALALVLLIGAGLLVRSFRAVSESDPGFRPERILTLAVPLPQATYPDQTRQLAFFERAFAALNALPGVESSAATFGLPIRGFATATFGIEGRPVIPGQEPVADYRTVSPAYFRTLGIQLLNGREFSEHDTATTADAVVINEELARRHWPGENAIGKRLQISAETTRWREVIGVVGNAKLNSLEGAADPAIYVPLPQNTWPSALRLSSLAIKTSGDPNALAAPVRSALRAIDPALPLSQMRTMDDILAESLAARRFNLTLLLLFAAAAGLLAVVGIYGVMSHHVARQTRDFGIRVALGARASDVMGLVLREGAKLALAGAGLGSLAALALTRLLAGLLAGVSAADPAIFAGIAAGLCAIALLACYLPARRAARVDPILALKAD